MIGFLLFIFIIILEFILLYQQIKTNHIQYKKKRAIRISSLSLLLVFTFFNIFDWGFRYYPIVFVYVLMILANELSFFRHQYKTTLNNRSKLIKKFVSICILFGLALLPALLFPKYQALGVTGPHLVSTSNEIYTDLNRIETFTDTNQNREVGVRSWYPSDIGQTYPLIIYSHGGISLDTSNESLFLELASHGYIVLSIAHTYHSIQTKNSLGRNIFIDRTYMNELNQENATENPLESYEFYQKWMKLRKDDINFVIDQVKVNINKNISHSFYNSIDMDNIGIIGHSLGGSAALCMGRTRSDVKVVIALESPFLCDITGATDQGFIFDDTPYPIPVLNIYSDSAIENLSIWPQYEKNYLLLSSIDEASVNHHIVGTHHFSLTDLSLTSPILTRLLNGAPSKKKSRDTLKEINQVCLDFLNSYLK